jgi:hypothetical protein
VKPKLQDEDELRKQLARNVAFGARLASARRRCDPEAGIPLPNVWHDCRMRVPCYVHLRLRMPGQSRQHALTHVTQTDYTDFLALAHAGKLIRMASPVKKAGLRLPHGADNRRIIRHTLERKPASKHSDLHRSCRKP